MNWLFSLFFGAGAAAWVFSKMSRRLGQGNTSSVVWLVGVVFVLTTLLFYSILVYLLNL